MVVKGDAMDHVLGFLEVAGCFLFWVTYLVVLRAVAHAKRPDAKRTEPAPIRRSGDDVSAQAAKSVA